MRIKTSKLEFQEICMAIGSPRANKCGSIEYVTTNSKEVLPGDLFFALKGDKYDGEDFSTEAKEKGAFVVSKNPENADFLVADTEKALLDLASYRKKGIKSLKSTIAITGSVGKTTTKNIISKMLSPFFKVHSTSENENNAIGVAITLLSIPEDAEILVVELGMNHRGEIKTLSEAAKPDISIITAIGNAHVGNLGSLDMIIKEKLSVLEGMDNPLLISSYYSHNIPEDCKSIFISLDNPAADYQIKIKKLSKDGSDFQVLYGDNEFLDLHTDIPGEHVLTAITYGITVSFLLGLTKDDVYAGIKNLNADCTRGKLISLSDFSIYDDTYSSSPEAVIADLKLLSLYKNQKSCMLGDMLECGSMTKELHESIGKAAYSYGARRLYLYGVYAPFIACGAKSMGMKNEDIFINTDIPSPEITAHQILNNHDKDEIILFKASNKLCAHRIIDILKREIILKSKE